MKGVFVLAFFVAFIISCGSKEDEFVLSERENDIHDIITTIIKRESYDHEVKILISLKKLNVLFEEEEYINEGDELRIPDYDLEKEIPAAMLVHPENPIKVLDEGDLDYLVSQNENPDTIYLEKELFKGYDLVRFKELKNDFSYPHFVEFTIPIFSRDNTVAYVREGYYCGSLCGSGHAYILNKVNGKWIIVDSWETWIS